MAYGPRVRVEDGRVQAGGGGAGPLRPHRALTPEEQRPADAPHRARTRPHARRGRPRPRDAPCPSPRCSSRRSRRSTTSCGSRNPSTVSSGQPARPWRRHRHTLLSTRSSMPPKDIVRIAALGDLHYGRTTPPGSLQPLFAQINDIRRHPRAVRRPDRLRPRRRGARVRQGAHRRRSRSRSSPSSATTTSNPTSRRRSPRSSTTPASSRSTARRREIDGIGFAGIKGFAGGFGRRALGPWGEEIIKKFVHEAVDEALKLESALARLRNDQPRRAAPLRADPGDGRRGAAARSIRSSAAAASKIRSRASLSPPCSTATRITARPRGARAPTFPSTTSRASLMREIFPDRPFRLIELGPSTTGGTRSPRPAIAARPQRSIE